MNPPTSKTLNPKTQSKIELFISKIKQWNSRSSDTFIADIRRQYKLVIFSDQDLKEFDSLSSSIPDISDYVYRVQDQNTQSIIKSNVFQDSFNPKRDFFYVVQPETLYRNSQDLVHGAFLSALLEYFPIMSASFLQMNTRQMGTLTISVAVRFIKSVKRKEPLFVKVRYTRIGNRLAFIRCELLNPQFQILATSSNILRIFQNFKFENGKAKGRPNFSITNPKL